MYASWIFLRYETNHEGKICILVSSFSNILQVLYFSFEKSRALKNEKNRYKKISTQNLFKLKQHHTVASVTTNFATRQIDSSSSLCPSSPSSFLTHVHVWIISLCNYE